MGAPSRCSSRPTGSCRESADILRWVDERLPPERRLYPSGGAERAEVEAVCRRLDERLGPVGRRLIYVHMLGQRELMVPFNNQGVPRWEAWALRLTWPVAIREMKRQLAVEPDIEREDEAAVWEELDWVAERRADGRRFLCGERFSAADLTFAALSASVIVPPVYGVRLPGPDLMRPDTAALVDRARDHPAGRYAMELFATERRAVYAS